MFKKLSKKTKIAIIGFILYLVLPIDFIPDFIPGFGQVDDLAVLIYVIKCLFEDFTIKKKIKSNINQISESR